MWGGKGRIWILKVAELGGLRQRAATGIPFLELSKSMSGGQPEG